MFDVAEIGRKLDKDEFRRESERLRPALLEAQHALVKAKVPVVLLVGGVDGAGKSETVNLLSEWLDPRGLQVNIFGEPTEEEHDRPAFWRYWMSVPPRGRIGIYYGSWYTPAIVDRVFGCSKEAEFLRRVEDIRSFERQLADDGALIVKLWFHLSKKAQKKRLKALEKDKLTRWRVTREDWKRLRLYDRFREVSALVIQDTSVGHAPWTVIEGVDHRYRSVAAADSLLDAIRRGLFERRAPGRSGAARAGARLPEPRPRLRATTLLDALDLDRPVEKDEYEKRLARLQARLNRLAREASFAKLSTVVVYEGMDAAGKGGNIRRLTSGMDARSYRVTPIAAPTDEERSRPYLWRFWRALPRAGRVNIFDRSWYGRVLVERVEGFCSESDWRRAYGEINEFEEQLHRHGSLVVKFWIQISKEEQLRRFRERQRLEYKRFKITEEDWRNRKKWDAYCEAVEEMVARTSTPFAPWTLVEGNSKYHARLKTIDTLCDRLEAVL